MQIKRSVYLEFKGYAKGQEEVSVQEIQSWLLTAIENSPIAGLSDMVIVIVGPCTCGSELDKSGD